jgi:hypothetical protein
MTFKTGDIISYIDMCLEEGTSLQRGMNFRLNQGHSVILMSIRPGAPYNDRLENDGRVLIYEGHDIANTVGTPDPKTVDQPLKLPSGKLTQNGLFFEAAHAYKDGLKSAELVRVYEKIRNGIWVYNGVFALIDARQDHDGRRHIIKFKLQLLEENPSNASVDHEIEHTRFIPSSVKLEVWKRDNGRCIICGDTKNLHFDHIIPFSKGGTSIKSENIQLLCAKHNLGKHDRIE